MPTTTSLCGAERNFSTCLEPLCSERLLIQFMLHRVRQIWSRMVHRGSLSLPSQASKMTVRLSHLEQHASRRITSCSYFPRFLPLRDKAGDPRGTPKLSRSLTGTVVFRTCSTRSAALHSSESRALDIWRVRNQTVDKWCTAKSKNNPTSQLEREIAATTR